MTIHMILNDTSISCRDIVGLTNDERGLEIWYRNGTRQDFLFPDASATWQAVHRLSAIRAELELAL